jgi:hypothetical protein
MKKALSCFGFGPILVGLVMGLLIVSGCGAIGEIDVDIDARETIRGSGDLVTEEREVSGFDRLSLVGAGDVMITQGEDEALTVEAEDNLIPYLMSEVQNGKLVLGFTDAAKRVNVRPGKGITFHLRVKELRRIDLLGAGDITLSSVDAERLEILLAGAGDIEASSVDVGRLEVLLAGAGDVRIDSLKVEALVIHLNGAGDVELAGQAAEQGVFLNGAGNYRAGELESQATTVEVNGVGDVTVWARNTLDVRINGPSTVKYYGSPQVTKHIDMVGRLVSLGNP